MAVLEPILAVLKNMLFHEPEEVQTYLESCKLTIPEIDKLYCMWYKCDKSCLQGSKAAKLHGLKQTVKSLSGHVCIAWYDSGWGKLTREQKQCFINCTNANNNTGDIEVYKADATERKLFDDNFLKFLNYKYK